MTGAPNKEYYEMDYIDNVDFEIGDTVLFRKHNNAVHKDIMDKKTFKIQRRQIICTLKN